MHIFKILYINDNQIRDIGIKYLVLGLCKLIKLFNLILDI